MSLPRMTRQLHVYQKWPWIYLHVHILSCIGTPVCSACLKELPRELRSLSDVVCRRAEHSKYFKQGFRWMTPSPSDTIIRPTPFNVFHMSQRGQKYRNNHNYQSCDRRRQGYSKNDCIFPHSHIEEQWWNQWQETGIDEIALTHVGKQLYIRSRNGAFI